MKQYIYTGLAGLQPGSSATTGNSRFATLQRGSSIQAKLELGEPSNSAKLELGEPSVGAVGNSAKLELGEPSVGAVGNSAKLELGEPSGGAVGSSAKLELGEPSGGAAGNSAKLELGEPSGEPSGELKWTDRGYMPHVDGQHLIQHVSYHLADSLPKEALEQMSVQLKSLPPKLRDAEKEKRIAAYIDAGKGSCVLRVPEIAEMVQNAFLLFHGERYILHAWCVMPNHVHVLFQPVQGWSMSKIVASWKSYTGRRISEYLKSTGLAGLPAYGLPGSSATANNSRYALQRGTSSSKHSPIWHREYWDRYIRDRTHYSNVVKYIHENPVKAKLVSRPEDWKWSSAFAGLATHQRGSSSEQ
ncbi:MAG: transposase [Flavobacteriales bacterium]|nr:transposase [Flavobacteriales bacterium]